MESVTAAERLKLIVRELEEKKAENIVVLKLDQYSSVADYFVVASGNSDPQLRAMVKHLHRELKAETGKEAPVRMHFEPESGWAVLDAFDIMVHLFVQPVREFYQLEALWSDAESIDIETLR